MLILLLPLHLNNNLGGSAVRGHSWTSENETQTFRNPFLGNFITACSWILIAGITLLKFLY